jgi:cell wall assembly regulator SMI1
VRQIESAEATLGLAFPEDLRELLLCANGQDVSAGCPIFPAHRFAAGDWTGATSFTWLNSVESIVEMTGWLQEEHVAIRDGEPFATHGPAYYHDRIIGFTSTENSDSLVIDLQPAPGGSVGQVVMVRTQPCQIAVLAPRLRTFLAMILDGYAHGRYRANREGRGPVWSDA